MQALILSVTICFLWSFAVVGDDEIPPPEGLNQVELAMFAELTDKQKVQAVQYTGMVRRLYISDQAASSTDVDVTKKKIFERYLNRLQKLQKSIREKKRVKRVDVTSFTVPECFNWTHSKWDEFLKTLVDQLLNSSANSELLYRKFQETYDQCREAIELLNINSCLARVNGYLKQFGKSGKNHMFSGILSNDDYYSNQPEERMQLPPELARAKNGLPKNWKEIAEKKGWKYALFHSGSSYQNRLVIIIPGEEYEQRLVFFTFDPSLQDPTEFDGGLQMQMIEKKIKGVDLKRPRIHFRSWGLKGPGGLPRLNHSGGRCADCHPNGPRALIPSSLKKLKPTFSPGMDLASFNKLIIVDSTVDLPGVYEREHMPESMTISNKCNYCHDGELRSSLSRMVDGSGRPEPFLIMEKVELDKSMPANNYDTKLNEGDGRHKLTVSIEKEFKDKLSSWLLDIKCTKLIGSEDRLGGEVDGPRKPNGNDTQKIELPGSQGRSVIKQ